jgi:cholesterol oxidase
VDRVPIERVGADENVYAPALLPLHSVVAIERGQGGRYAVTTFRLSDEGEVVGAPRRLMCKHLFLAAGSIGTTSLLVRARETGALPALNEHVGRHPMATFR